ncbi:MAG: hypothetical protein VCF07_03805 [Nitrospinota bacterium]
MKRDDPEEVQRVGVLGVRPQELVVEPLGLVQPSGRVVSDGLLKRGLRMKWGVRFYRAGFRDSGPGSGLLREGLLPAFPIRTGPIPFDFEVTFARLPISVFARTAASVVPASADRGAPFFKKFFGRK